MVVMRGEEEEEEGEDRKGEAEEKEKEEESGSGMGEQDALREEKGEADDGGNTDAVDGAGTGGGEKEEEGTTGRAFLFPSILVPSCIEEEGAGKTRGAVGSTDTTGA